MQRPEHLEQLVAASRNVAVIVGSLEGTRGFLTKFLQAFAVRVDRNAA